MQKALNTIAAMFAKAGYKITSKNLATMFSNMRDTPKVIEIFKDQVNIQMICEVEA